MKLSRWMWISLHVERAHLAFHLWNHFFFCANEFVIWNKIKMYIFMNNIYLKFCFTKIEQNKISSLRE